MRELNLDEVWDYTKRMWKWVAFQKEVLKDPRSVEELKSVWLRENTPEFVGMTGHCFFCKVSSRSCKECPGKSVDSDFDCCNSDYNYYSKPGAFYREILRLDAIRTARPPEHVWEHGDVFKNHMGVYIYLVRHDGPKAMNLRNAGCAGSAAYMMRPEAEPEFLFNVREALSGRGLA